MSAVKKIRDNCGGISIVLLWIMVFFIIIVLGSFVVDVYYTNAKAEIAKDAVTMSALSIYKNIDRAQLASGDVVLDDKAKETFKEYLAKNLKLNSDLTARPNSIAVGQVTVEDFILYKKDNAEKFYPDGGSIYYKPSVYVRIKFDVEPILKGIVGGKKTVYSSAHVDLIDENK